MSRDLLNFTACGQSIEVGKTPLLMGVLNASPDSFSDGGDYNTVELRLRRAQELVQAGATILDIGGESAVTNQPAVAAQEEIERVAPLIERVKQEFDVLISVDTYKPLVAEAAIAAGATIVNDVSGLRDPELADICCRSGAALVLMHTRAVPKQRLQEDDLYPQGTIVDVLEFLTERVALAKRHGVEDSQLILDPGPDFAKTPAQTVEMLREIEQLSSFQRPLLLAISRKDFIGAITGKPPRERLVGTLAALAYGMGSGGRIYRVHDVAAASEFIAVLETLNGLREIQSDYRLADALRWQSQKTPS